jgi:PIN domain nuclease of toxin-antitoxin system
LLLDTHAARWFLNSDDRLGENASRHLTGSNRPDQSLLLDAGVQPLAVSTAHAAATEHLPPHHRDPFDRMLVAQAGIEGAALVSRDGALRAYDVTLVW